MSKLTPAAIDAVPLAPRGKTRKLNDGKGLFLLVTDAAKGWRFRFKRNGKDALMSLGVYPDVTLGAARAAAQAQLLLLERGEDPIAKRQTEKAAELRRVTTFGVVAGKFNDGMAARAAAGEQSVKTLDRYRRMYRHAAKLHGKPLTDIKRADMLALCEALARSGRRESAHRLGIWFRAVWLYAIDKEYVKPDNDPTARGFSKSLTRDGLGTETVNRPALIDPPSVGALMRVVDGCEWLLETGHGPVGPVVGRALRLLARTCVRPGELAAAEWNEFDLAKATWVVPRARMKMKEAGRTDHIVPLSRQAVAILKAQYELTGHGRFVFPHHRTPDRPMTGAALPAAMVSLGYRDQHCPHGFRSTFSTLARDYLKQDSEVVERQLDHKIGSDVSGAYDKSQRLTERRELMQRYADLLDRLRDGGTQGTHD